MTLFKTLGGEVKQQFTTGAQRGSEEDKLRFEMLPVSELVRLAKIYSRPSAKLHIDDTAEPLTGYCPVEETDESLIPALALNRLGGSFWRGAFKYGRDNWQQGIPLLRVYASLFRHMIMWFVGDTTEDHLAAVIWNASVLVWTENEIAMGHLPKALANAGPLKPK